MISIIGVEGMLLLALRKKEEFKFLLFGYQEGKRGLIRRLPLYQLKVKSNIT
jgi:hypothetical protein